MRAGSLGTALRYARAIATNQLARYAPALYVRATRQTGRGAPETETAEEVARYFIECVHDYFSVLGVDRSAGGAFLAGKTVLEYGPGDLPGVALMFVAMTGEKAYCLKHFPMLAVTPKNGRIIQCLIDALPPATADRSRPFQHLSEDDFTCLEFWLVFEKNPRSDVLH
jgi:hypothetical protein